MNATCQMQSFENDFNFEILGSLGQNHSSSNMYLSSNIFQYCSNFITKLSELFCHWMCKVEDYTCSFNIRSKLKEQCRKQRKRMSVIVCFNVFQKLALNLSLVPTPYLPHFQSIVSDLKLDGCANQCFTKLVCIRQAKMQ